MRAHQLAETLRRLAGGGHGGAHRGGVATEADRNETAANALDAQQLDVGGLGGGVSGLDDTDQAPGLDQTDGGGSHGAAALGAASLTRIVDRVGQQAEIAGALDGTHDAGLLRAAGPGAAGRLDLTDRRQEAGQHVETLVVDLFGLELRRELFAVDPGDDARSCGTWMVR